MKKILLLLVTLILFFDQVRNHPFVVINDVSPDDIYTKTQFTLNGQQGYSGYINVDKTYGANLFYTFWEARDGNKNAPIILWLQGGPGCSSIYGMMKEIGPVLIEDGTLKNNANTWNQHYHTIFIDNPVGAGYSYVENSDGYVTDESQMSQDLYDALTVFFSKYSDYSQNDFYVFGESYGGKYVPAISYRIYEEGMKIKLKGFGVGDGLTDPINQLPYFSEYAYALGLIDQNQKTIVEQYQQNAIEAIQTKDWDHCETLFWKAPSAVSEYGGGVNVYDIRRYSSYDDSDIETYLDSDTAKNIFGTQRDWQFCSSQAGSYLYKDFCKSVRPLVDVLVQNGVKAMFYNGQFDLIVNLMGATNWINQINWAGKNDFLNAERTIWKVDGQVAGYARNYQNLYQVFVNKGGHMSPMDQPENTLDMVTRFIENKSFN